MTNSGGVMPDPVLELHGPEVSVFVMEATSVDRSSSKECFAEVR